MPKLVEIGLALSISTEVENVKSLQTDRQRDRQKSLLGLSAQVN